MFGCFGCGLVLIYVVFAVSDLSGGGVGCLMVFVILGY